MKEKQRKSLIRHYKNKKEWHTREMEKTGNQAHLFYIAECDEKIRELEEEEMKKAYDNVNVPPLRECKNMDDSQGFACTYCNRCGRWDEDNINHPKHYTYGKYEVIDVIEDWRMNYHLGNAVKYIARCEHKENKINDLKKAIWYLNREIEREEAQK